MPFKYTQEQRSEIEERVIAGLSEGTTLADICRQPGMPGRTQVYEWRDESQAFGERFAQARELGFEVIASTLRDTARGQGDSTGDVQRDKLIVETDLKLLSKWSPGLYGDRTILAGDANAPLGQVSRDPIATILALVAVGAERAQRALEDGSDLA